MQDTKKLILVDGSSYLFRAFHGLPELTSSSGQSTHAILGVLNMLKKLCNQYPCEHIAVIFDAKGKNFRHQLYPAYKAHRQAMPESLASQIEPLHTLIRALGYPLIQIEGVEADDVIGTLTHQALADGISVLISSGDKDLAQLVQPGVKIVDTMKDVLIDEAYVYGKFLVHAHQIVDFLALTGDTADNIPGVPSVGPKTAARWLHDYGSVDTIVAQASQISGKVGESLRSHLDTLALSKALVTLKCDVAISLGWDQLMMQPRDIETLQRLFHEFELKSWMQWLKNTLAQPQLETDSRMVASESHLSEKSQASMGLDSTPSASIRPSTETYNYRQLNSPDLWAIWKDKLLTAPAISIELHVIEKSQNQLEWLGIGVSIHPHEALYIPLSLPAPRLLEDLKHILEHPNSLKIGHDLKSIRQCLKRYGIVLEPIGFDTLLASYVLDSGRGRHDLESISKRYLGIGISPTQGQESAKSSAEGLFIAQPSDTPPELAARRADILFQLAQVLKSHLQKTPALYDVYQHIEMPTLQILQEMEETGVLIDGALLKQQSDLLAKKIGLLETQIHQACGETFNVSSPKQLQTILYEKLQLPVLKKTPGGQPSTAEEALELLAESHDIPKWILEYRHFSKLKSTYTDRLPEMIDPITGRVHTHYHQTGTITGRLSSSDPNLQNIPIRSEHGRAIRTAFIARPGYQIVSADYSQIELRIMAHLSEDPTLLRAFSEGVDIHRATAAEVLSKKIEDITLEERRQAKAVNFGLIYGMSAFGLAKQLGISRGDAQRYVDLYFERYPNVLAYMNTIRDQVAQYGYVETLRGRRLYLPEIRSKNLMSRKGAERAAINAPMQGSAADMIKLAMIGMDQVLKSSRLNASLIMQVHDELVFEVARDAIPHFITELKRIMLTALPLNIPLDVSIGIGDNWEVAH